MKQTDLLLKPRMSEKAYASSEQLRTYVFDVPKNANRLSIANAIEKQYEVSVTSVNLTNIKGKAKRTYRKSGRSVMGQRSGVKKAFVTLAEGSHLPIFEAEKEAEEKQAKTTEAVKKAGEKVEKKAAKKEKKQ